MKSNPVNAMVGAALQLQNFVRHDMLGEVNEAKQCLGQKTKRVNNCTPEAQISSKTGQFL